MPSTLTGRLKRPARVARTRITQRRDVIAWLGRGRSVHRPTFVIGSGRCGSSLLSDVMATHPELAVFPGEGNDLWHPRHYPIDPHDPTALPIEADALRFTSRSVGAWPSGHAEYIQNVLAGYHRLCSGQHFVLKSAMITHMIGHIRAVFPDARVLYLYRNGASVTRSLVKKNRSKARLQIPDDAAYERACATYWASCVVEGQRQRELHTAGDWLDLTYEGLCESPRRELTKIAEWMNIDPSQFALERFQFRSTNAKVKADQLDDEAANALKGAMRAVGYW